MYTLRWEFITNNWQLFAKGLMLGLWIAVVSLAIGAVIGLLCAFARASNKAILSIPVRIYVELIRNIPLLLIVFLLYFGLPQAFPIGSRAHSLVLDLLPTAERTFIVGLSIYSGAYLTEIFYAGLLSVSTRYLDAGKSLGLQRVGLARWITIPIMARTVLPSLSNTFISLFKDTSIAVSIAVPELTFAARKISTDYFRVIEAWTAAAALYLVVSYLLAASLRFLEGRIRGIE